MHRGVNLVSKKTSVKFSTQAVKSTPIEFYFNIICWKQLFKSAGFLKLSLQTNYLHPLMSGLPTSYLTPILNLITLVLLYSKVEGELFFWSWTATLSPTLFSLILIGARNLFALIAFNPNDLATTKEYNSLKLHFIRSLFNIIFSVIGFLTVYTIGAVKDKISPQITNSHVFALVGVALVVYIIYSAWADSEANKLLLPAAMQEEHSSLKNRITACFSAIFAPCVNFLGASMVICSGGGCTTIYGSTISAIFGAFGVSATEWLPFLDWLTGILVLVSIYVIYTAKHSVKYPPFIISAIAGVLIITNMIFLETRYPIYAGNILMILAAYLNYKMNVPNLFRRKPKSMV